MTKRPRVLQIFNRYLEYGGEQGSVFRLGDALQETADVEYFTTSSRDLTDGPGPFSMARSAMLSMHNPIVLRRLQRYQAVGRFDAWQVHNIFPTMSPSVYALAFRAGIPVVQYLHNYRMSCVNGYFLNHGSPCTSCIGGNFTRAALTGCWRDSRAVSGWMGLVLVRLRALGVFRRMSAWIALSRRQKDLHVQMGVPGERIHVIPHFFEPDERLHIGQPGKDVLFVGRLSAEKGVAVLLDAWRQARTGDAALIIAGDGPERPALEKRVRDEGIARVEFHGFVPKDRQADLWRRAAFSVVPSVWHDPLPTVVFEAWERGRPALVSDAGGLSDIVDSGVNGVIAPPADAEAWGEAISRLLPDTAGRVEMAANGLAKLRSRYARSLWLERISLLYSTILAR